MTRPSERLRAASAADWQAVTRHPFVAALADGSMPPARMAWYLVQDYSFIDGFVRLAASAIAHAPSLADSVPLAQFLAVVTGPENTYFQRSFEALGVPASEAAAPVLAAPAEDFRALMAEVAASGDYGRMMAVLTVAEWTYLDWASPHAPAEAQLPFWLGEWVALHSGPGFEAVVAHLRAQLDAAWTAADAPTRARIEADFARAVALERAFFDAA